MTRYMRPLVAALAVLPALLLVSSTAASPGTITRVSVDGAGNQATGGDSASSDLSADGRYVAYHSAATNLVLNDTNGASDVFVRDMQAGTISRVSVDSAGTEADAESYLSDMSADGRYVVFYSFATNLVSGDTNGKADIFVHDLATGTTARVNVDSSGNQGTGAGNVTVSISDNGRYIAFSSDDSNLAPGDTNGYTDVFVRDRVAGETALISVSSSGAQGNSGSSRPSISADGRYVVFSSYASNLVPGDTNNKYDLFLHDRLTGTTTLVTVDSDGNQANDNSFYSTISVDGRYVAFPSDASNLVPNDTNGEQDIFLRDMQTGTTTRISVSDSGAQADSYSMSPEASGDWRYIAFASRATNLVPDDTNGASDIFRYDRQRGEVIRISVNGAGHEANGDSLGPSISEDGSLIAFHSLACNLVEGDTNNQRDVFLHDLNSSGGSAPADYDTDCDGIPDSSDNCPAIANPDQADADGDGIGDLCDPDAIGPVDNLSIDVEDDASPANLPTSIGTVEHCRVITDNDILDADEDAVDSLTVDVVVGPAGVPPGTPLKAFQYTLNYDPGKVKVSAADNQQLLASAPGSDLLDLTDATPDSDGLLVAAAVDFGTTSHETGAGVLTRLTLEGIGAGIIALTLTDVILVDYDNNTIDVGNIDNATVVVGSIAGDPCSDLDGDGVSEPADNCPDIANEDQADNDGDGIGDVCDPDDDNDTFADGSDNCELVANADQANTDGDGLGDACDPDDDNDGVADAVDNCPIVPNTDQSDLDSDGLGDVCDPDTDGDGFDSATETTIGTLPLVACPTTAVFNDEEPDAWPADFDDSQVVDIVDVLATKPVFNSAQGDGTYLARNDLTADDEINVIDVLALKPFFGQDCAP